MWNILHGEEQGGIRTKTNDNYSSTANVKYESYTLVLLLHFCTVALFNMLLIKVVWVVCNLWLKTYYLLTKKHLLYCKLDLCFDDFYFNDFTLYFSIRNCTADRSCITGATAAVWSQIFSIKTANAYIWSTFNCKWNFW